MTRLLGLLVASVAVVGSAFLAIDRSVVSTHSYARSVLEEARDTPLSRLESEAEALQNERNRLLQLLGRPSHGEFHVASRPFNCYEEAPTAREVVEEEIAGPEAEVERLRAELRAGP